MRFSLVAVVVFSVFGLGLSAAQKDDGAQGKKVCSLKVSGMFCGACAKTVEKAAKKIAGVTSAKVSQPKGVAEITYDPAKTNPDAIAKVITEKTPFKAEAPKAEKEN